jgi:hypothetical protein
MKIRPLGSALFGGPISCSRNVPPPHVALSGITDAIWSPTVLQWTPLLQQYGSAYPLQFLYAWLKKESGGNPCSYTTLRESGIFQLMPPGNTSQGGTTEAALRAACSGSSQQATRALTQAEAAEQVRSGIQYLDYAKGYARQYVDWPESNPDFWKMVKMVHVAPARVKQYAPGSSSWAQFRQKAAAGGDTPANWLDNAEWVGSFGTGVGNVTMLVLVGLATAGALFYLLRRKR